MTVIGFSSDNAQTLVEATENGAWAGTTTQDVSTGFHLRNESYPFENNRAAYLRFDLNAVNNTIGGIAFDDIAAVNFQFYVISHSQGSTSEIDALWILNDGLTNSGTGELSEPSWDSLNMTRDIDRLDERPVAFTCCRIQLDAVRIFKEHERSTIRLARRNAIFA